jgi:DNA polymerase I
MLVAVSSSIREGQTHLQALDEDGRVIGSPVAVEDLPGAISEWEAADAPRWVWPSTSAIYPDLLRRGIRVRRCHDLELTDGLLAAHDGHWAPPVDPAVRTEGTLFDVASPIVEDSPVARYAAQRAAMAVTRETSPGFGLLVAAESGAALAAAEMSHAGLPWRTDVHDTLLESLLGQRARYGGRPERLQALAEQIAAALDEPLLNPDSNEQVLRALRRQGLAVQSNRAREIEQLDHPAVPLLLEYKELARLHSAHGWAWREQWVHDGRFHPEYVVGGVVSGRWASRGGGALQIPRSVRVAVVADSGWRLVVADARQLEPRVLAALSGDSGMAAAAAEGDIYAALAKQSLGGDRAAAKLGLLSAMYGGSSPALVTLRRSYPAALALLESAARAGERGESVRSVLGRTSPRAEPEWSASADESVAVARERARGRFTRNFVIQASAADWANVLLSQLRGDLLDVPSAELVFFQHDEVVVHVPEPYAAAAGDAIVAAGMAATRLVFGATPVAMPMAVAVVESYADAK